MAIIILGMSGSLGRRYLRTESEAFRWVEYIRRNPRWIEDSNSGRSRSIRWCVCVWEGGEGIGVGRQTSVEGLCEGKDPMTY